MDKEKDKRKEGIPKGKGKTPTYKLQSDIESSINLKGILEERILDAKIEFTLREALGIVKKDFPELIIDIIKKKKQMIAETMMTRALDIHMTENEEEEIGQVFALMCDHMDGQDKTPSSQVQKDMGVGMEDFMDDEMEYEVLQIFTCNCVDKIKGKPKVIKNQQDKEV